jgi:hypothetical protein
MKRTDVAVPDADYGLHVGRITLHTTGYGCAFVSGTKYRTKRVTAGSGARP